MENTLSKPKYIKEHIIWLIISVLWGKNLYFKCILNCTYVQSALIFCGISLCIIGGGIFITWKQGRNYPNIFKSVVISWGFFVVLGYTEYYKMQIQIIFLIALLISVIMTIIILGRKIKHKEKKKQVMKHRFQNVFVVWGRSMAAASLVILIPLGMSKFFYGSFMNARVDSIDGYDEAYFLENNMDEISKIYPDIWDDLDNLQERVDACQLIANDQIYKLGISHEIEIGVSNILEEGTLAYYSEAQHRIIIDCELLKHANAVDIISSICHECRHCYQIELTYALDSLNDEEKNLLLFRDIAVYKEELTNYNDGSEDYEIYYTQELETDAREYAAEQTMSYLTLISEYLREKEQSDI